MFGHPDRASGRCVADGTTTRQPRYVRLVSASRTDKKLVSKLIPTSVNWVSEHHRMLSSKTFVKKTRRGAVLKVVREHYLRDDIACGVKGCAVCYKSTGTSRDADGGPVLDPPTPSICSACPAPHLLLPDTNVALHQLDVLEDEVVRDVVLLQTVLQEAKHRSVTAHKRCVCVHV